MRLGLAVANAGAAYEGIKGHRGSPLSQNPALVLLRGHIRERGRPRHNTFSQRVPSGYTSILLASPVFKRSMAREKSLIGMRSVITGCRSSLPALSSAVIWYQVWYMRRPLMPCTVMPLKIMSSEKFNEMGFEVRPSREIL